MSAVHSPIAHRPLRIGAVCRRLQEEFPDISISKIRYLEDQGLLAPTRTQGGYRLYSEEDVERLRTILRLQRDEFLPLRVIRDELAAPGRARRDRRRAAQRKGLRARLNVARVTFDELCERSGADPAFVRELEEYGIVEADRKEGLYLETDADVVAVSFRLARYGIEPRNLRAFRTGVDREVAILEQLVAPALRARSPERRQSAVDELETLGGLALELSQMLFWRSLRAAALPAS